MQVLTADEIRAWDKFTIENEPVTSIDLMERAATGCVQWMEKKDWSKKHFLIFCGKGNNGGDGLAIARLLLQKGYIVRAFILETDKAGSPDFETNL